ncbi:MAG: hypothetical protein LBB49_01355 [Gracilibacteraceae bacterium]|jgi:hypothetical protein|nr:hypothetical protein [Gracilibacteraceae bacterium]
MRGDIVYRVYGRQEGRAEDTFFGAYRQRGEAEAKIEALRARVMHEKNWAEQYHNRGFVLKPFEVSTDFEIPATPKPRDRYFVESGSISAANTWTWGGLHVSVFRRGEPKPICAYRRNYTNMYGTFEPFRQNGHDFALISTDYTMTTVLDLVSGEVVAEEPHEGFCPAGFYVPDWWDVHDGTIIPGSQYWGPDEEWPNGDIGFVWGCLWGDDDSWKVQLLDLSRLSEGVVAREERFGYLPLAAVGYDPSCLHADPPEGMSAPPPFIRVHRYNGQTHVTFNVPSRFDLESGAGIDPLDW